MTATLTTVAGVTPTGSVDFFISNSLGFGDNGIRCRIERRGHGWLSRRLLDLGLGHFLLSQGLGRLCRGLLCCLTSGHFLRLSDAATFSQFIFLTADQFGLSTRFFFPARQFSVMWQKS